MTSQFSCEILPASDLDEATIGFLIVNATREGSDFQKTLARRLRPDGHIAIVADQGEIVGWCRTEPWSDDDGFAWDTLEAFVRHEWRDRGVAAFAAAGLWASGSLPTKAVAVFRPEMLLVAARGGFVPTLFERCGEGWREVR